MQTKRISTLLGIRAFGHKLVVAVKGTELVRVRYTRGRARVFVCCDGRSQMNKKLIVNRFVDTMHAQFLFEISKSIAYS